MIYLDNAATTQPDPRVVECMKPWFYTQYGNAGSLYSLGREAAKALQKSRNQVAALINAKPEQIVFTSGATEGNNAVFSMLNREEWIKKQFDTVSKNVLLSAVEHPSVMNSVRKYAEDYEFILPEWVDPQCVRGKITVEKLKAAWECMEWIPWDKPASIVSVMHTNNETGVKNDVKEIAKFVHDNGALYHMDAVQGLGYDKIDVQDIDCDFMTMSAHKIHGPKGVGALYIKDPDSFVPMIYGGETQEFGLRAGTENVPGIVGFGEACEIVMQDLNSFKTEAVSKAAVFTTKLLTELGDKIVVMNTWQPGGHIASIRFKGIDAETLLLMLDSKGVCASAGSACHGHSDEPSYVLTAMGLTDEAARSSLRFSFSRMNTMEEVTEGADIVIQCVKTLASCA